MSIRDDLLDDLLFAKAQRAMIIDRYTMGDPEAECMQCRAGALAIIAAFVVTAGALYLHQTRKATP